jgi:hypothetical protein
MVLVNLEEPLMKYYKELDTLNDLKRHSRAFGQYHKLRDTMEEIYNLRNQIEDKRFELCYGTIHRYKCIGCNEGIVTSNDMQCGRCNTIMCERCMCIIESDSIHECKEENVKSVFEINKTSKNCPTCLISISKIDGCDQMFCTECHTPFSYNSGEVIRNSFFHNPHYFDFLEKNPGVNIFLNSNSECVEFDELYKVYKDNRNPILRKLWIAYINIYMIYLPNTVSLLEQDNAERYNEIRKKYMYKSINASKFKKRILKDIKMRDMAIAVRDAFIIMSSTFADLLMGVYRNEIKDIDAYRLSMSLVQTMNTLVNETWKTRGWARNKPIFDM